ncbi:hypothetical protein ALC62_12462 [Cyphomyrmex costatus]|uniref:Uncharacterized protein n=1 Tax=Cyphomyrmex costatus TaxID=456900 RepID=A0A151IB34_9HYME|nr:hypothetical protein ALC62_12462 [Cyphomyrmex costatus]
MQHGATRRNAWCIVRAEGLFQVREACSGSARYVRAYVRVCGKLHARLVYRLIPVIDRRLGHGTRPTRG